MLKVVQKRVALKKKINYNTIKMQHQDWNPVVLNNTDKSKKKSIK